MTEKQQKLTDDTHTDFYTVDIEEFEGPLDLLLSLVKKSEINIYDIPISEISDQYNRHLTMIEECDLDAIGAYLPLLAELGFIKSKMLLPRTEEEDEVSQLDPRMELARRLVVYERFRDVAMKMADMNLLGRDVFVKGYGYAEEFGDPEIETETATSGVWKLIASLCEMRARINENDTEDITFVIDPVSVERRIAEIHEKIKEKKVIEDFNMLFEDGAPSKRHIVISFMAILELAKKEIVELFQKKPFSSIRLLYSEEKKDGEKTDKENG